MPKRSRPTGCPSAQVEPGDSAAERLLPIVYDELRRLAAHYLQSERADHTLQPTALVHEAYLRLAKEQQVEWKSTSHFFAIAARALRQILVNHAHAHLAAKRGGAARRVMLDERVTSTARGPGVDLLDLDAALHELADRSSRQSQVVELRFFGGLGVEEVAEVLGVSPRTVEGDWTVAKAWLRNRLHEGAG